MITPSIPTCIYPVSDWLLLLLRGRGRDEMCEVLSELVGTKVERIGITRLITKQSTSSSSLRHDIDCLSEGKEAGEGK